jgi:hypothetical protein
MKRFLSILLLSLFAAVTMAGTEVYTPILKSPLKDTINMMPNTYINWHAVAGSIGLQYNVQLDTSANFNSPQLLDTTLLLLTGYKTHELLFGAKYYWRVRAIDMGQTSAWSTVWDFSVFSTLTLIAPKNNSPVNIANDTIYPYEVLIWSNVVKGHSISGIKYYDIQIDTSLQFNSPLFHSGTVLLGTNYFRLSNLRFATKYYWRVRARHNLSTGSWNTPWNFTVATYVKLSSPAKNATNQLLNAKLSWGNVKGVLGYEYQLATDSLFNNVIAGSEVDTNFTASSFTVFGQQYYWHVRARTLSDTMSWCLKYAFTTIDKVLLLAPTNGATNIAMKPTLKWQVQTGITKYQLQVSAQLSFDTTLVNVYLRDTISQFTLTKQLSSQSVYYWRMRAFSDSQMPDTSGWSPIWSFTTGTSGISENGIIASSIYPNPASGKVYIKLDMNESTRMQVELIDLLGKSIFRDELELTSGYNLKEINLEGLSRGVYIIRLSNNGSTVNHKLIIEK